MKLATLLDAISSATGPVTPHDLANRLGVPAPEVIAMIYALRASGQLGGGRPEDSEECTGGSCAGSCPGPTSCPLVIDVTSSQWTTRPNSETPATG